MMIIWLDHLIFGNGHGIKSPYFDDVYFWQNGEFYLFSPGLGAQLTSFQWNHPRPQERRIIANRLFSPFCSRRSWGRVIVSWSLCGYDSIDALSIDRAREAINELQKDLQNPSTSKGRR